MKIELTGLDDMMRNLDQLAAKAEALDGEHKVKLSDLFPTDFMRRFTDFVTLDEMFEAFGFRVEAQEDLDRIPAARFDEFVSQRTLLSTWDELKTKAAAEWVSRQLGLEQ